MHFDNVNECLNIGCPENICSREWIYYSCIAG